MVFLILGGLSGFIYIEWSIRDVVAESFFECNYFFELLIREVYILVIALFASCIGILCAAIFSFPVILFSQQSYKWAQKKKKQ